MSAIDWVRFCYERERPANRFYWHKWNVFIPVRTRDGSLTIGYVWRRRVPQGWEYTRRPIMDEERAESFW